MLRGCCSLSLGVLLWAACSAEELVQPESTWEILTSGQGEALLSVGGTSEQDIWFVGADRGSGPVAVHFDGKSFTRHDTGHRGDLWWVQSFPGGLALMAGSDGAVLEFDGVRFVRLATPSRGRDTIFGLWGVGPEDAWFVGGGAGRDGFVWRLAGGAFTELPLPASVPRRADGELPSVLKVWGSSAREVWFAGDRGLLMRSRGSVLEHIPLQTSERLFTVHGSGSGEQAEVIAVGGNSQAVVAESQRGFQPEPLPQLPLLQGVFVDGQGALAVGQFGVIVQRTAAGWQAIEADLPFPAESLHAIYRDPSGRIWTVGGNVLSARLDGGIVMVRSPRPGAALPPWPGRRASAAAFPSHP